MSGKGNFVRIFIAILLLLGLPAVCWGATLFEYYNTGDDDFGSCHSSVSIGQTFSVSSEHSVTSVKLLVRKANSPSTFSIGIFNTAGGLPTGGALTTANFNGADLPIAFAWTEFALPEYTLTPVQYAIVMTCTSAAPDLIQWAQANTGTYTEGSAVFNAGAGWVDSGAPDRLFEIWGGGEEEPPAGGVSVSVGMDDFVGQYSMVLITMLALFCVLAIIKGVMIVSRAVRQEIL